jgi:TonB-linked SusC/RagA family outer membrane protein
MTNAEGTYRIVNVTPGIYRVQASRIGYVQSISTDIEVKAGQTVTMDLTMSTSVLQLQKVVVAGAMDPTAGANRPFAAAKIDAADMPVPAISSPAAMLQGRVAGVTVRTGGGPNGETTIQLRNPVSYRASTQPLIIIDGIIQLDEASGGAAPDRPGFTVQSGRGFAGNQFEIDPQDIESMEIVRGAAAAALYGQRAANGAIIITTKRGGSIPTGSTQLQLRGEAGVSMLANAIPLVTRHRWKMNPEGQYIDNFGRVVVDRDLRVQDPDGFLDNDWTVPTYDPIDAFFGTDNTYVSQASLSQNTLSTTFSASVSGTREAGILKISQGGTETYSTRVNLTHRFSDRLRATLGSSFSRRFASVVAGGSDVFRRFALISPDVDLAARDANGFYLPFPDGVNSNRYNPLYEAQVEDEWEKRGRMQVNGELSFTATPWITFQGLMGYDRSDRLQQLRFRQPGAILSNDAISEGEFDLGNDFDEAANGQLTARLQFLLRGFNLRSTLSALGSISDQNGFSVEANDLDRPTPDLDQGNVNEFGIDHVFRNSRQLSYLATTAVDYESRYILEGLYRYDGNSLLGTEKWQPNFRASAAWALAEEPWWPFANDFQLFKLRYSVGSAGNNPLFDDRIERYVGSAQDRLFKDRLGNDELIPEKVIEQEIGLDMSFRNRFGLELTYARQNTSNAIREDTILSYTGFDTQVKNLGDIRGETYELTFEGQWFSSPNFSWTTTLVADRSRSKITSYPRACRNFGNDLGFEIECEGYVFGQMYGNKFMTDVSELSIVHQVGGLGNGESLDWFDINDEGYLVAVGPGGSWRDQKWGTEVYVDGVGYDWGIPIVASLSQPDGQRISRRVFLMGQALPDFQYGFQNAFNYKNWNLFLQVNGQVGGMIYNRTRQRNLEFFTAPELDQTGKPEYAKKPTAYYVQNQGDSPDAWNVSISGNNGGDEINLGHFMEEAGYLKLGELQFGYTFRESIPVLSRLGMKRGNVSVIGRNLYTFTGYEGYDPEVGGQRGTRVDTNAYPPYRTVSFQFGLVF